MYRQSFRRFFLRTGFGRAVLSVVTIVGLVVSASGESSLPRHAQGTELVASRQSQAVFSMSEDDTWGSTWSYNPYNPNYPSELLNGLVDLPLAVPIPPTLKKYSPQIASSWSTRGRKLTVHIRPNLKWQDGKPITSRDVVDTTLLNGASGVDWTDLANVSAPSSRTVVFTIRSGVPTASAEQTILGMTIYPASEYGTFVSSRLKSDDIAYYNKDVVNPTAASKMPQHQVLTSLFTRLSAYDPKSMVGDGPFRLRSMTLIEAKLAAWPGFFDASKVHAGGVDFLSGATNNVVYPWLYSGKSQYTNIYDPPSIITKWLKKPYAHVVLTPAEDILVVAFNDHRYPLNMVKVRQALAYLIPRRKMVNALSGGTKYGMGVFHAPPDGMTSSSERLYLTRAEVASLQKYPFDPTKAAALLRSVGFRKRDGQWIMPNGKQFTLSFICDSADTDVVADYELAGKALTSLGIKTSVLAESGASQSSAQATGNFDVGWNDVYEADPLAQFADLLGTSVNYESLGASAGSRGIGFGPEENVPGLGRVNVAQTITAEAASTELGPAMDRQVWDWARLVDQQVPFLQYLSKVTQVMYSTKEFVGWPPSGSDVWSTLGADRGGGFLLLFEAGTLKPRR